MTIVELVVGMLEIEFSRVTPLLLLMLLVSVLLGSFLLLFDSVDDSFFGSVGSGLDELAGVELGESLFSLLAVLDVVGCELVSMFVSVGSLLMVNRSFISDFSSSLLVVELLLLI